MVVNDGNTHGHLIGRGDGPSSPLRCMCLGRVARVGVWRSRTNAATWIDFGIGVNFLGYNSIPIGCRYVRSVYLILDAKLLAVSRNGDHRRALVFDNFLL